MTTFVLDTLAYAETLKSGGFTETQAATQARALAEILDRQIATKTEVETHENNLRRDIRESELRLEARIADTNARIAETHARIAETKAELTRWIIGAGVLQTTVIGAMLMKMAKLI